MQTPSALLALLAMAAACSSVIRVSDPSFSLEGVTGFAWRDAPRFAGEVPDDADALLAEVRRHTRRALEAHGVRAVDKAESQIVLSATLQIRVDVEKNDRNYALHESTQFEHAVLTLQVFDRAQRKLVWEGETSRRLRASAQAFGGLVQRWEPTGEARNWQLRTMVEELLAHLPE